VAANKGITLPAARVDAEAKAGASSGLMTSSGKRSSSAGIAQGCVRPVRFPEAQANEVALADGKSAARSSAGGTGTRSQLLRPAYF